MSFRVNEVLCILFFFIAFSVGILISSRKPLWNDERYSQINISVSSYKQIISPGIQGEGNKSPLFYLQQKLLCDVFRYNNLRDPNTGFERILLRIPSVAEISLFLCLLCYYFSRRFNLWFGCLGILVALSSLMLWWYWAEARPYGLWVLLTAWQMFIFIHFIESPVASRKTWWRLGLSHILLALTCVLSVLQIAIISLIVLFKDYHWKKFILLLLFPLALAIYYKPIGPANHVIFTLTVDQMLRDNIARDRLYVLLFYPFLLFLYFIRTKFSFKIDPLIINSFSFFLAVFSMLFLTVEFFSYLRAHALNQGQYVVSRHLIFLLPVGIISVTYLTGIAWEALKGMKLLRIMLLLGILITLFYRSERIIDGIKQFFSGLK